MFQSSPDPKAGCDPEGTAQVPSAFRFQSSPDPKAGCDAADFATALALHPFQSSPDPKAGCDLIEAEGDGHVQNVSILTRPEGRVRRRLAHLARAGDAVS